ncbi:YdeI/OmpD-associated family protein [Gelidibacter pelagius]|uniref:YdeI/OmpD-associated family protein n=1 Tax=Gelidibacter pelagius TaxID=2819985 RepID=A0ABS3ST07_9FLAO|nr:YdeI/OmpD-associated family protein [Gelidibacter pelagius]MBO3098834.1 YdeI/OmpD-associated family protein [Gelidibacter pelagius]
MNLEELYIKSDHEWREWLHENHSSCKGVHLIFYKIDHEKDSMRWEEAVKVALCYGWIDSTARSLGDGKRRQYFTQRNATSVWSALNKRHIIELTSHNLMHDSGFKTIEIAKQNGSWTALDAVENGIIPEDLQIEFNKNTEAFQNYQDFAPSYRKNYLYWLNQAKREITRKKRIIEIITLCENNVKSRGTR